jgi:hypothetical protein
MKNWIRFERVLETEPKVLSKDVERLNSLPPPENPLVAESSAQTELLKKIRYSIPMAEILDSGFSYDKETEKLSCSVCEDMSTRQVSGGISLFI